MPQLPEPTAPWSFPLVATLAPVIVSVVMWLVTQSVLALVFAALGPVIAVGSLVDSRVHARRRLRQERQRFATELHESEDLLVQAHDLERAEIAREAPAAPVLIAAAPRPAGTWRTASAVRVVVSLGRGQRSSALELGRERSPRRPASDEERRLDSLLARAAVLCDSPITVEPTPPRDPTSRGRLGVGIVGAEPTATALGRAIAVQLSAIMPPERYRVVANDSISGWAWLSELPHLVAPPPSETSHYESPQLAQRFGAAARLELRWEPLDPSDRGDEVVICIGASPAELPGDIEVIVRTGGDGGSHVLEHPNRSLAGPIRLELVSEVQAFQWAQSLASSAVRGGFARGKGELPERLLLRELRALTSRRGRFADRRAGASTLACSFAVDRAGPLLVDLVADGPHAIVGGTTGSGKSELLTSWVLAMAAAYSPNQVTFLLIDFKGGASFGPLRALPHCVGMVTDLDAQTARRALDSLGAELRHRERTLGAVGAKSIDDSPGEHGLPRLVIVVDEFAAMAAEQPELHALFSDIAARGRSLGVHLILCTQRPAGVIREAILANSALRISLRVNNRADSTAVVGTDAAAGLPAAPLGRALVSRSGQLPELVQLAIADGADIDRIIRRAAARKVSGSAAEPTAVPRRPWLDPLPGDIGIEALLPAPLAGTGDPAIDDSLVFGLSDEPEHQSQPPATYQPGIHGHLLVVGDSGAGKTTFIETVQASGIHGSRAIIRPAAGAEALWDTVSDTLAALRSGDPVDRSIVLLDDLDALLPRFGAEHQQEFLERLGQLLREAPAAGIHCMVTVQRISGAVQSVASLFGSRLLLSMSSRQEFVLAGGDATNYRPRCQPGAGVWLGHSVQIARCRPNTARHAGGHREARVEQFSAAGEFAVVSSAPAASAERLRKWLAGHAASHEVIVIDGSTRIDPGTLEISEGRRARVLVGDPESWQSLWGAMSQVRARQPVLFDGCTPSEFRSVTRARQLPPPLAASGNQFWLLRPHGQVVRATLAAPGTG